MKTQEEEEVEEPSVVVVAAAAEVTSPSANTSEQPPSSPMHQRRIESVRATIVCSRSLGSRLFFNNFRWKQATLNIFISLQSLSNAKDDQTKSASAGASPGELWSL